MQSFVYLRSTSNQPLSPAVRLWRDLSHCSASALCQQQAGDELEAQRIAFFVELGVQQLWQQFGESASWVRFDATHFSLWANQQVLGPRLVCHAVAWLTRFSDAERHRVETRIWAAA